MLLEFIKKNNIYSLLTLQERNKLFELYFGTESQKVFTMNLNVETKMNSKKLLANLKNKRNKLLLELMEKYY